LKGTVLTKYSSYLDTPIKKITLKADGLPASKGTCFFWDVNKGTFRKIGGIYNMSKSALLLKTAMPLPLPSNWLNNNHQYYLTKIVVVKDSEGWWRYLLGLFNKNRGKEEIYTDRGFK
jgi:hypothetical protein